jgi:pimeloyl-ACP methyl ester carboxylesterase
VSEALNRIPVFLWLVLLITALAVLSGCSGAARPASSTPSATLQLAPCPPHSIPAGLKGKAQCGTLTVFEDRQARLGRTIDLRVVVLPAVSRSPAPDPVFYLAGGPGQSAVDSFNLIYPVFRRINQKRDLVLVDQRGTGASNPLDCPAADEELMEDENLEAWLEACLAGLDADPALYTTPIAMQDLDELRQALGYEQINLYGVSYGTRAALTYLRMYPEQTRSLILDGVVPQDQALGIYVALHAQQALDQLFASCEADERCRQAFPDVSASFQELMTRLEDRPVLVELSHPTHGQEETLSLSRDMLSSAVRLLSYTPETAALLPLLIHTAAEKEDYRLLAAQYLILSGQLESGIAEGMGYSVLCAEDAPFIDLDEAARGNANTYLGSQQTELLKRVCQTWPRGSVPDGYKEPVTSDRPVLLLSGELDPVTPPENGEAAARTLPNSLHLVGKGQGHNIIYRGCLPSIATAFIESGSVQGLNPGCVQLLGPPGFFLNFSGPTP